MKKRLLSLTLIAALCLSLLPVSALAAGEHDSHSNGWTEFTAGTTTLSGGSYYLSGDVEYSGTESITVSGEVILCLNDHKLDLKGQHISVGSGASLTLCDCSTGGVLTGGSGSNGGGVYVGGGGTFTMTGGSIAGNTANAGGGVYVDEGGTFTMEDGSINNNQATSGGGGGVMVNKGSFTLSGGSITGNATNDETWGYGGGVCLYGTFYLSGDAIIQKNTKAGATDNLYLGWNTIKITGPLGENARIGVTAEGVPRSFINGWSDNMAGENPADYFSSDGDALGIGLNADGNVVLGSLCTTITLDPKGGTLPEYSLVAGAALPIPTKTGYTFAGWYEDPEFSGNPVTDIPTNSTENLNFYAKWTVNTYTVTFDANGGSVSQTSAVTVAGKLTSLPTPTYDGYDFLGWYTQKDGGDKVTTDTVFTVDSTIYAHWQNIPVTGVKLDKTSLTMQETDSDTLTATVEPDNATNKNVNWESSDTSIATVDASGKVTAISAGSATITVTTVDGNKTATCAVTVTEKPVYSITASPAALNFGSIYDDQAAPAAQTVTITNTGNQSVTVKLPTSTNYTITAGTGFTNGTATLVQGATATFNVQPKAGLGAGTYNETLTISGDNDASAEIALTFTVNERPYTGKYSYEIVSDVGENGTIDVDRYATEGDQVTITVSPDEAYLLDDLTVTSGCKDVALTDNGDGTYTFTMPSGDVAITATFAEDPNWEEPATDVSEIFTDVPANHWAQAAIQYAYDNGLMTGVSDTAFAPEATTTRAMIVSMLARMENVTSAADAGFSDVAASDWYATAVNWAASEGIVGGFGDGTFQPNSPITREQMASILYRYAEYKGVDVSARAELSGYADAPSPWAADVMQWAVAEGLLAGVTDDQLQPQGQATRAQVAAIMQRFLENVCA